MFSIEIQRDKDDIRRTRNVNKQCKWPCDCNIAWMLGHWMEISGAKARCGAPASLKNKLLKKLEASDLTCDVPMLPTLTHGTPANVLDVRLEPSRPQIVFQGDSLRLRCHVGLLSNDLLVRWYHNGQLVSHEDVTSITNLGPSKSQPRPSLGHQSQLYIDKLVEADSGNWTCSALVDTGLKQNVISSSVVLCPANTSKVGCDWGGSQRLSALSQVPAFCKNLL